MGNYIASGDLDIPQDTLLDLVDDEDAGSMTAEAQARVDQAIADAEALVDGYCGARYAVPFATPPGLVKNLARRIAEWNLYNRRDRVPEAVQRAYDGAVSTLKLIAQGKVSLGVDPGPAGRSQAGPRYEAPERVFTRDTMKGF